MRVIIVDDEAIIRSGLRMAVPWAELGIREVLEADSGQEALKVIAGKPVDLVITDIQMAEMTGLDLISEIRRHCETVKIIVITGYDEFDYARQCLRMQVQEFLLKPVEEEVLIASIRKQLADLQAQRRARAEEKQMRRVMGTAEQMLLERLMRKLLRPEAAAEDIALLKAPPYQVREGRLRAAILLPSVYAGGIRQGESETLSLLTIKNLLIGFLDARHKGITFSDDQNRLVLVVYEGEKSDELETTLDSLVKFIRGECEVSLRVVLGNPVAGLAQVCRSYNDARHLISEEHGQYKVWRVADRTKGQLQMFREVYAELKSRISEDIGNIDAILKVLKTFAEAAGSYNITDRYMRRCCFELAAEVYYTDAAESREPARSGLDELLEALLGAGRSECCELTGDYIRTLLEAGEPEANAVIARVKGYINEHLTEDISVSEVARAFHLSPNYFSRLFKRITGERCNEYIVRRRIERAKYLLTTTNFKVGRIAADVGYQDTNYFSLSFKKQTGLSPLQYRDRGGAAK